METNSTHAWVLHNSKSGETSLNTTFLTAKKGVITCLCQGGRTPKKHALLQPFSPLWIHVIHYPNRLYVQKIESVAPAIPLVGDALFSALYVNELLYHALKLHATDKPLFDAYLTTLRTLATVNKRQQIEPILRRFEWILLDATGYTLPLNHDAQTGEAIIGNHFYQFVAGQGLIQAQQGILGEHLLAMSRDELVDPDVLKAAKYLMRKAINYLLEGVEIQTKNLYNQAFYS